MPIVYRSARRVDAYSVPEISPSDGEPELTHEDCSHLACVGIVSALLPATSAPVPIFSRNWYAFMNLKSAAASTPWAHVSQPTVSVQETLGSRVPSMTILVSAGRHSGAWTEIGDSRGGNYVDWIENSGSCDDDGILGLTITSLNLEMAISEPAATILEPRVKIPGSEMIVS